jgi:hypothetical protein
MKYGFLASLHSVQGKFWELAHGRVGFLFIETEIGSAHLFVHLVDGSYRIVEPPRKSVRFPLTYEWLLTFLR